MSPEQVNVVQLPPEALLADDNTRFGLKQSRLESLKASIIQEGRVLVPLEVEPLEEPSNGASYRVRMGHYRREAVADLNKNQGAGLTLPCIIVPPSEDKLTDLKTLVAENFERQDLTTMDMAVAMDRLLKAGMSKQDVRALFSRPGGRKGNKVQPISNSLLNMYVSFLDFPKKVQNAIHEGLIGVTGAYELAKKPRDKWDEILAKLEEQRIAAIEQEEKDEEKYLEAIKKEELAKEKIEALKREAEEAAKKLQETSAVVDQITEKEVEAFRSAKTEKDPEKKKAAEEAAKAMGEESRAAIKAAEEAKKAKEKLDAKVASALQTAEERKKKLEAARKEAEKKAKAEAKKKPAASGSDVNKAAAAAGVPATGQTPLKLHEIRSVIHGLALPSAFPKVRQIGEALENCINGGLTDKQLLTALAKITGEKK